MTHTTYRMVDVPSHLISSEWIVDGLHIRLEPGRKGPGDLRIAMATPGGEPLVLRLSSLGAVVSLWYRNEDRLYPHGSGGRYTLGFLEACCQPGGLRAACALFKLDPPIIETIEEAANANR